MKRLHGPALFLAAILFCEIFLLCCDYPFWRQTNALVSLPLYHEPHTFLGWRNKPGKFLLSDGESSISFTVLDDGSRFSGKVDADAEKDYVLVGDSYVQGYGLSDDQTFTWKIQQKNPASHIINRGSGGYGTYQSLLSIEDYLKQNKKKPQAFIYLFNLFHETRNAGDVAWMTQLSRPPPNSGFNFPYCSWSKQKNLECLRSDGIYPLTISKWFRSAALFEEIVHRIISIKRLSKKREVTQALLQRADKTARLADSKFQVVFFDFDNNDKEEYQRFLAEHSISYIDCASIDKNGPEWRMADGHPNAKLNDVMANCIEPLVQ